MNLSNFDSARNKLGELKNSADLFPADLLIRVERALKGKNSRFQYAVHGYGLEGLSSTQPLLDACRAVQALGADPRAEIALFREGATDWDLKTTVGYGARLSVDESRTGFRRFEAFAADRKVAP